MGPACRAATRSVRPRASRTNRHARHGAAAGACDFTWKTRPMRPSVRGSKMPNSKTAWTAQRSSGVASGRAGTPSSTSTTSQKERRAIRAELTHRRTAKLKRHRTPHSAASRLRWWATKSPVSTAKSASSAHAMSLTTDSATGESGASTGESGSARSSAMWRLAPRSAEQGTLKGRRGWDPTFGRVGSPCSATRPKRNECLSAFSQAASLRLARLHARQGRRRWRRRPLARPP